MIELIFHAGGVAVTGDNGIATHAVSPSAASSSVAPAASKINVEINDWRVHATPCNSACMINAPFHPHRRQTSSLSVVVVGASGDLAKKKIFPALFALYYEGLLPKVRVMHVSFDKTWCVPNAPTSLALSSCLRTSKCSGTPAAR